MDRASFNLRSAAVELAPGRAPQRRHHRDVSTLLTAWALTLGLAIALLSGASVAAADTGAAGADQSAGASTSDTRTSGKPSEKSSSRPTSVGGDADAADPGSEDNESSVPADDAAPEEQAGETDGATEPITVVEDGSSTPAEAPEAPEVVEEPDAPTPSVGTGEATPRAGPAATDRASAATATASEPTESWWDTLVRDVRYTFFNKAPTLSPTDNIEVAPGVFTGKLNGQSNNGLTLNYLIKQAPTMGTLTIDQEAGTYTYTFDPSEFDKDTRDSFVIVADNGAEARRPGLFGVIQLVMHNIAIGLGLSQRDTVDSVFSVTARMVDADSDDSEDSGDEELKVSIRGTGFYGNLSNKKYWAEQNHADNCLLMSILMIEGQFTGQIPTRALEEAIVEQAKRTPSVVDPSKMMYLGEGSEDGVLPADAAALLKLRGNAADLRYFPSDDEDATYYDGLDALDVVSKLLFEGHGVITGVNNQTIWDATEKEGSPGADRVNANHGVVVIAVDTHNGRVYINDPGVSGGRGLAVPLGAFMWAWAPDAFETITADGAAPQSYRPTVAGDLVTVA